MTDPFEVLGLDRTASIADVRAARRKLALTTHPDLGGDPGRMAELNRAVDAAVGHLTGRRPLPGVAEPAATEHTRREPPEDSPAGRARGARRQRVQHDLPAFVVELLPVEAFEALLVVASWIGRVLVDEPPYLLDVHLDPPLDCWCRLELLPDAGSSTVGLTVAAVGDAPAPDVDVVRDVWVAELNRLGGELPPS